MKTVRERESRENVQKLKFQVKLLPTDEQKGELRKLAKIQDEARMYLVRLYNQQISDNRHPEIPSLITLREKDPVFQSIIGDTPLGILGRVQVLKVMLNRRHKMDYLPVETYYSPRDGKELFKYFSILSQIEN